MNLKGRSTCVYGRVVRVYEAAPYGQIIRFSAQPGDFLVRGENYYFEGVYVGQCVMLEGTIYQSASYLYMDIDDLSTELAEAYPWVCNS